MSPRLGEKRFWKTPPTVNAKVINLLEALGDSGKTEETVEGMQEDGHDHGQLFSR